MKMIVGLGNPTSQYERTRHNAGWLVLDALQQKWGGSWKVTSQSMTLEIRLGGERVLLLKPLTYMNLSGRAVDPLMRFYKLSPSNLLIIQDDLDSPFGLLRLKMGGRSGGQKGVQSIIEHLNSEEFARLKLGISRPPQGWATADWVLSPWSEGEKETLLNLVGIAKEAAVVWAEKGLVYAQQIYNGTDLRMGWVDGERKPHE